MLVTMVMVRGHTPTPDDPQPTSTVTDDHKYYTLTVYQNNINKSFDDNFIDMENAEVKSDLSNTMVGALSITPLFSFPFYGHLVSELFITTHGFLSLSPRLHDYIYKTLGISFNAYRTKAYDGGGEENLTFQGTYCNNGGGLDIDTGIFTCPCGGTYMFQFHIATHD